MSLDRLWAAPWLAAAALKAGKKLEHFTIAASIKTAAKKARPNVRAARKK